MRRVTMTSQVKPRPLALLAVLLLATHSASPAPTHPSNESQSQVSHASPRPTSQPSWHLLLALWRPKGTSEAPTHGTTLTVQSPGSTLPLLAAPSGYNGATVGYNRGTSSYNGATLGHYGSTSGHTHHAHAAALQGDDPDAQETGARPPMVIQEDPGKSSSPESDDQQHNADQNLPASTQPPQIVDDGAMEHSGPGKWMNKNAASTNVDEGDMVASRTATPHDPQFINIDSAQTENEEQISESVVTNIHVASTSGPSEVEGQESEANEEVASHPGMTGKTVAKYETTLVKVQSDNINSEEEVGEEAEDEEEVDLPDSPELDDHFFVHPFPHHRDVVHPEEEGQNPPVEARTGPHYPTAKTEAPSQQTTISVNIPGADAGHNDSTQASEQHLEEAQPNFRVPINLNNTENLATAVPNNQTAEEIQSASRGEKGHKVLEFQGPVVMESLDEPSLVPLVGGTKEILTMKDDESAVLALLRVAGSSNFESQFQLDIHPGGTSSLQQESVGVQLEHNTAQLEQSAVPQELPGNPEHSVNPDQPLAATIIDSHRGATQDPDIPTPLRKKGSKSLESRKTVNALDSRDKTDEDEDLSVTSEASGIPTTTKPIYEEISGTLKVDTSIDDVEDFEAHVHHTENTDEFLPPTNTSHTNLIDVALHNTNTSDSPQNLPQLTSPLPQTSTPHSFNDYPSHYPPKLSTAPDQQDTTATDTTATGDGEGWSNYLGNISGLANVSLALNESLMQRTLELSMDEHNRMVLQERGSLMLQLMDPSADPCDDFYQFACGKWNGKFPIRQDKAVDNTFERLKEDLDDVLRSLLEEPQGEEDNNITRAVKTLYSGCMNTDAIELLGAEPLLELLTELGGWPVLEGNDWNGTDYNWVHQMAKLRNYNNDILVSEWVAADITNSSNHIIQLDQPELGLPGREYFINPGDYQYREAYLNLMVRVTQMLGAPLPTALVDMTDVLHFEKQVSRILTAAEERRNLSAVHRRMTLQELSTEVSEIDWKSYLEMITWENNQTEEVVVFGLDYFKKLVTLLNDTSNRTVSNYLLWRFVKNRISNLGDNYTTVKQDYIKVLFGRKSQPERWRSCVTYVSGNLGYVVGAMFVKRYFPEASKNDTDEMIGLIRESFRDALDDALWMHSDTRRVAQQKVDTIVKNVGYPEYLLNDTYMDTIYAELSFENDTHFSNVLKMLRFHARTNHNQLSVPVNRTAWVTSPAVVNAYYSRSKNMIVFPAGILQPPFYHPAFPRSLNYGGIGVVIGHEITHGFDDRGRQFDKNGNLQQWWKPEDVSKFYQRASCMLDQYGEYKVDEVGLKINPVNTLGENIADNAGIKISYQAYKTWRKSHEEEVSVPYVPLTHDQLFFLNFGQIWCEVNSPEAMLTKLRSGQHSPNKFRVIGTLSNSEEFSEAFNCPVGSRMNPERKCRVW